MNNTTSAPENCIRFVRRWRDTDYPVIAHLTHPFDLVAHPNGPAITDGDWISVIDIHPDDPEGQQAIKREAQKAWRKYSWDLLQANFYPQTADVEPKCCENCGSIGGNSGCNVCGPPLREKKAKARIPTNQTLK